MHHIVKGPSITNCNLAIRLPGQSKQCAAMNVFFH